MSQNTNHDIIIIGGGCAGLTAAVYACRAGKSVLVLEAETFGGQIAFSPNVENFPGFESISGVEFADKLMSQAASFGADIELENVTVISADGNIKSVTTDYGTHTAKAIIIATGLKHRKMSIPGENELIGRGISFCSTCDGAFFSGKNVCVFGGGNAALTDALFLSDICKEVIVIHRRRELRGDDALVKKLSERKNVRFLLENIVADLEYTDKLTGIVIENTVTHEKSTIKTDGLFVSIGREPSISFLNDSIKCDGYGYISAGENCKTNVPGIFAAGDCRTKDVRQLTTAAGDGACAALGACMYIDNL